MQNQCITYTTALVENTFPKSEFDAILAQSSLLPSLQ